ncbi:MAG: hypothetical protein GY950_19695, partial [bacterium]|nr:hypothetical protein [bacterium]
MKRTKFYIYMAIVLTFLLITAAGCGGCGKKEQKPQTKKITKKTAKVVSYVTSGNIYSTDQVRATFVQAEIPGNLVGTTVKQKIFHFTPPIDGITEWKNRRTLVFKPNAKLPLRQKYKAELRFNELIPAHKKAKPLMFSFTVQGREIADVMADFELKDLKNPNVFFFKGSISFTEPLGLEQVKEAVALARDAQEFELEWREKEKDISFEFRSPLIQRSNKTQFYILKVNKGETGISQTLNKKYVLEPLKR